MLLINKLLSAGFELLIFSLVPACWWLITARKQISFAQWIGRQPPSTLADGG